MTTAPKPQITRTAVIATARGWLGTPYHHQASTLGVGADCVGLVRGVWRNFYDQEAAIPLAYSRDWAEATGEETLLASARRHLVEIDIASARAGDVLIFRFRPHLVAKHAAIISGDATIIHALEGVAVAEVPLVAWWRRRIAAAFAFPGIID